MTSSHSVPAPPSAKQLRYLKDLAMRRGVSFAYPKTSAEASAAIDALKAQRPSSTLEQTIERRQAIDIDLTPASSVRDEEIVGYGSSARWS